MCLKKIFGRFFVKDRDDVGEAPEQMVPGLVREYTMFDLMGRAVCVYDRVYVPVRVAVFEDKWIFEFNKFEDADSTDFTSYSLEVAGTPTQETVSITLDGAEFIWDDYDGFFRWAPFEEAVLERKFNTYMEYFSNGELRIEKEYAEHNLSPEALHCAWYKGDTYYSWNVHDGMYAPVLFEMPALFDKKERYETSRFEYFQAEMGSAVGDLLRIRRYLEQKYPNKSVPELYAIYEQNENRVLWEPDNR